MPKQTQTMNVVELNLTSLEELGEGAAFRQVQILMAQAVADVRSRPGEKKPRKLTVQFELSPRVRLEEYGEGQVRTILDAIALKLRMNVTCPPRETLEYDCGFTDKNSLVFNPEAPHNHRQVNLPEDDENPATAGRVG